MNVPRGSLSLLLAATLLGAPAAAQSKGRAKPKAPARAAAAAPAKPTPANAKLLTVQDRRTDGSFPRCTLGIELPDVPAVDAKAARVVVTKAVDDLGTDLVREDAAEARLEPTQRGQFGAPEGKPSPPTLVFAELKNPPRKAKRLVEVAGEIELFIPSRDPNGEATLPNFLSLAGKPAAHPALKANGVEIELLSGEQLAAERKKAVEAERTKLKKDGYTDEESIREMAESALWSFPKGDESEVVLRVKDPKNAIQEVKAFDAEGSPVFVGKSDEAGLTVLKFWNETPKADWSLKVEMRSEKSLVRHTFAFRDVPLP